MRSILNDLAILKCKFLVISTATMFTFMKEIAQFKEDIKKSLKKLHHIFLQNFVLKWDKLLLQQPKLLDM